MKTRIVRSGWTATEIEKDGDRTVVKPLKSDFPATMHAEGFVCRHVHKCADTGTLTMLYVRKPDYSSAEWEI